MSVELPTRIVATFAPDVTIHVTDSLPAVFVVKYRDAFVTFPTFPEAIAHAMRGCGWGDYRIREVKS